MIDEGLVAVRNPSVHTVEIDGEAVLLDDDSGRLHRLNGTAALVWACLDGVSSLGEIVADLSAGLGAPYPEVLADSLAIVVDLGQRGLLGAPVGGDDPGVT